MFDNAPTEHRPDPVDLHVGARVRTRRKFIGLSQEALADIIGLTFQQVQKYERGTNRISCSKLHKIARALKAPVAYFFEGYDDTTAADGAEACDAESAAHAFLMTTEGIALANAFPRIASAAFRRRILELVTTMAGEQPA